MPLPDNPETQASIARNRQWNLEERRRVAARLLDDTTVEIVKILGFELKEAALTTQDKLDAILMLGELFNQWGEDQLRTWLDIFAQEKRMADGLGQL